MIWESWPWKQELAGLAKKLRKRKKQKKWFEKSFEILERDLFIGAYSIRKLLDAKKLSDEIESMTIHAVAYAPTRKKVDFFNWHKIEELYDLSQGNPANINLRDFNNQFIHSFIFIIASGPDAGFDGVFVVSEYKKDKILYFISADEITKIYERVSKDDICSASWERDSLTGEVKVIRKTSRNKH